jgi:hypothetical protein
MIVMIARIMINLVPDSCENRGSFLHYFLLILSINTAVIRYA